MSTSKSTGKHIVIAGNYASGKTTLTRALCERTGYIPFWEQPEKRPFQQRFTADLTRWSLANQIDFFTFRAQQELSIKQSLAICVQDSGLDQDMFVFTQHLFNRGVLDAIEFDLCKQVYAMYRALLSPADLIIKVNASISTIMERRAVRARASDEKLLKQSELEESEKLVNDWIESIHNIPIIEVDGDDASFPHPLQLTALINQIEAHFA